MAAGAGMHPLGWQNVQNFGGESKISLNNADTATFIRLYQSEELLWNVNLTDHTNRQKRTESLQRISKKMAKNWSTEQVRDKIMSLRSRYSKEIVKVRVSIASGADSTYQPVWRYFPMLDCFLRPFCVTRKTDTPVVRAFHKRLMEGGVSANQPSSPNMTYPNPPHNVSPTTASHFFHPPDSTNPVPASHSQRNQQNVPPAHYFNNDNDDDDDDDVQIVNEDVSKVMEEMAMLIDSQRDDDGDSGYNGGPQEGVFGNDSAVGSRRRGGREEGGWTNSSYMRGDHISGEGVSAKGCLYEDEEESSSHHDDLLHNSESVSDMSHTDMQQAQTEGQLQSAMYIDPTHCLSPDENDSEAEQPQKGPWADGIVIKLERPESVPSPPPPPLPIRRSLLDVPAEDSSFSNGDDSSGSSSQGHQASCHDGNISDSGHRTKRRQSYRDESRNCVNEPFLKRIKQEKDSELLGEGSLYEETDSPDLVTERGQQEVTSGCEPNPTNRDHTGVDAMSRIASGRRVNQGYQSHSSHKEVSSIPTSSSSQRNIPRTAANLNAHVNSPTVNRTREITSPASDERPSAASMVSQVTDAISHQMTSLLQTLVTSLAEKLSGDITADDNMAFANYVRAELTKLDEDLQADVKFSIQKVVYEAQKEMSRRRTQSENN
ncbi:hypothetical protein ACOMHN_041617 [Nucella lapillus]